MLPTFVIGLREGLEASLIVGIIAAFLKQRGRSDLIRWVFVGIVAAIVLCTGAGLALDAWSRSLPQRQQEGLETVIGLVAVAMVTYMVVWMKRHSRDLKGQLFEAAGAALAVGTGFALVAMSFLAVLREGLETVVFLLAAFNESASGASAAFGALAGIVTAIGLGYAIYRGGVRLNLSRFFRATGVVLVLVAAGLLVNAVHTAHEAGWLDIGQQRTVDLSGVVRPGTVWSSLLTGMLGIQSQPVLAEVLAWLLYLVPVGLYVAWPPGRAPGDIFVRRALFGVSAVTGLTALLLVILAPVAPTPHPVTTAVGFSVHVVDLGDASARVLTHRTAPAEGAEHPATGSPGVTVVTARLVGEATHRGVATDVYRATTAGRAPGPRTMSLGRLAARNHGHLPLGAIPGGQQVDGSDRVPVAQRFTSTATFWVTPDTARVVDARWDRRVTLVARFPTGRIPVGDPSRVTDRLPARAGLHSAAAARHDASTLLSRQLEMGAAGALAAVAAGSFGAWGLLASRGRRARRRTTPVVAPVVEVPRRTGVG